MKTITVDSAGKFKHHGGRGDYDSRKVAGDVEIPGSNPRPTELHEWDGRANTNDARGWKESAALKSAVDAAADHDEAARLRSKNAASLGELVDVLISKGLLAASDLPEVATRHARIKTLEAP